MEQFLFPAGPRLASFRGMQDYIIPGAEQRNSLAPFTHLIPSIYFLRLPLGRVSTSVFPHVLRLGLQMQRCLNGVTQILWAGSGNAFRQSVMASFQVINVGCVWSQGLWSDVRSCHSAGRSRL